MAYTGKAGTPRRLQPVNPAPADRPRPIGGLATGLVIGALLGATVALLFAPERGSAVRRKLRRAGFLRNGPLDK